MKARGRRPDVFNQQEFEAALRRSDCPESFVGPVTSDFRLFVPLVLRHLGEAEVFRIVNEARAELGLGEQTPAWQLASRHIVAWADEAIESYRLRRAGPADGTSPSA